MRLVAVVCLSLLTSAIGLSDTVVKVVAVGGAPIPLKASIMSAEVVDCVASAGTDLQVVHEEATGRVMIACARLSRILGHLAMAGSDAGLEVDSY
jgi:hypothetical protein